MLYKKLSFEQLCFTEEDRLQLLTELGSIAQIRGYGQSVQKSKLSFNNNFLNYIYSTIPNVSDSFMLIKGAKDSDTIRKPGRHIHIDDRLTALNIPLLNCKQGTDTVFYNEATIKKFSIPSPTNPTVCLKLDNVEPEEIGRFTLTMDSAYLLDTTVPHCKIQTYEDHRLLLSITIDLPFAEAATYFK